MNTAPHTRQHDPSAKEVALSILKRGVVPAVIMFFLLWGIGKAIMTIFHEVKPEEQVSQKVGDKRESMWNGITKVVSTINDTWFTIGGAILIGLIILALTRKWWLGILPVLAITLEASVFVPVTKLVGRPRPEVGKLDPAPPTSSFPSGHTAASFALYWSLAFLANRIENVALRRALQTVFFVFPFLVGAARLYRGMHHLSDILLGAVLGIVCAIAAYKSIHALERRS